MMSKRPKRWRVSAAALAGLALSLVAVAAEVGPPNGGGEPTHVLTVTRQGSKLFAKLTGQGAAQIYPETETKFFYKVVKAQIDFVADSSGNISSLVLHQNGADCTAPRVAKALKEQIDAFLTARIQAQIPMPGSEAAVRILLAGEASGKPDYDRMSPQLATAVRQQLSNVQASLAPLGPMLAGTPT
jgi:bla regulator protein BlaR1